MPWEKAVKVEVRSGRAFLSRRRLSLALKNVCTRADGTASYRAVHLLCEGGDGDRSLGGKCPKAQYASLGSGALVWT